MSVNIIRLRYFRNMEPIDPLPGVSGILRMAEWICSNREQLRQSRTKRCPDCGHEKPIEEFQGALVKERKRCAACTAANYKYIKAYRERNKK